MWRGRWSTAYLFTTSSIVTSNTWRNYLPLNTFMPRNLDSSCITYFVLSLYQRCRVYGSTLQSAKKKYFLRLFSWPLFFLCYVCDKVGNPLGLFQNHKSTFSCKVQVLKICWNVVKKGSQMSERLKSGDGKKFKIKGRNWPKNWKKTLISCPCGSWMSSLSCCC